MTAAPCPYCHEPIEHRPYAAKRDIPSVTSVLEVMDDGRSRAMAWAAAGIAASTAVHENERWWHLPHDPCTRDKTGFCQACKMLRSEFDRQWRAKADLGTHVHHLALSWAQGKDISVVPEVAPYVDALEEFYRRYDPRWLLVESTILFDSPARLAYRGQIDGVATLVCPVHDDERCTYVVDFKTGSYHPASQTLQLAAYRYARWVTDWSDGAERKAQRMPAAGHAAVLLLGADGHCTLAELPVDGAAHNIFLAARDIWQWQREMDRWTKEHPLRKENSE